jgi:hypothetical protein
MFVTRYHFSFLPFNLAEKEKKKEKGNTTISGLFSLRLKGYSTARTTKQIKP